MTAYPGLMVQGSQGSPTMAHLYGVLCGSPLGPGVMPLGCSAGTTLYSADFARIASWLGAGSPQN
jgi:hypothetical protein